jgi:hypothetical protein
MSFTGKKAGASAYESLMKQSQGILGSVIKGTKGGGFSSGAMQRVSLPVRMGMEERSVGDVIRLPPGVVVNELEEEDIDEMTVVMRNKIEERIISILKGKVFSKAQEESMCHWILSNGRKNFLEQVFHFSGFADDDNFNNTEPFNNVHNAAVVRERYRSKKDLIQRKECSYTESRVAMRRICQVGKNGLFYESIGVDDELFSSGLFAEEIKIDLEGKLAEQNVVVKTGSAEKSFLHGYSVDPRDPRGSRAKNSPRDTSIKEDVYAEFGSEAFSKYDEVMEEIREIMVEVETVVSPNEKNEIVNRLRRSRKEFVSAFVATQKFIEKSNRSEMEMTEEYRNVAILINRGILRMLGIEDQSKLDLLVDVGFVRNGTEVFLQKKLPPNFCFLPPLGKDSPFSESSRKNQTLTKFPFDGSTSFNSWACQVRDGIWRISEKLVPAARKYEHIKNECLDNEARLEFTGGVKFVSNYEMEMFNGMERLQVRYGLTLSSYSKLLTEMNDLRFSLNNVELMKLNLVKLQSLEEQMIDACPSRDPDELGGIIFDHLKSYMPHNIWSEVDSHLQSNCRHLIRQCNYSALLNFALLKSREILSRDSFQKIQRKSEEAERSNKKGKDLRVQFKDQRKSHERAEKSRMMVDAEVEEEWDDESTVRQYGNEQSSDEDSETEVEANADEGNVRKMNEKGGNNGRSGYQGNRNFGRQRQDNAPTMPLGFGMVNGDKKKLVDFEKVKSAPCFLCDRKEHGMIDCPLSAARKMVIIEDKVLCSRCFEIGHLIGECTIGRDLPMYCQVCKRKGHWDVLCWSTMNKKLLEERKKKREEGQSSESKVRKLTSTQILESGIPRKYREESEKE